MNYCDVCVVAENDEEIYQFRRLLEKNRKNIRNIGIEKGLGYFEGEIESIGEVQEKVLVKKGIKMKDEKINYIDIPQRVFYLKFSTFSSKKYFEFWENLSHLKCYFKFKDSSNHVYVNTDLDGTFFNEKFIVYLSDNTNYLSRKEICIDKDFVSEKEALDYINHLSKNHKFVSLRQLKMTADRLGENILFFEQCVYQNN